MKYIPKKRKSHGDGTPDISKLKSLGEGVVLEKGVRIFHPENVSIGGNVYIGHNTFIKAYFKNEIVIGDDTWIGQDCFIHGGGGVTIGDAVGIAPCVKILSSYHEEEDLDKPLIFCDTLFGKVIIEDGCDIGIGSTILPGKTIGKGSIIGAGSVVTKDVEPFMVVAGNPARAIRRRVGKNEASYTCRRTEDMGEIIWDQTVKQVYKFVKALMRPYSGAYTTYEGKKIKVWDVLIPDKKISLFGNIGQVAYKDEQGLWVICKDGPLIIKELEFVDDSSITVNTLKIGMRTILGRNSSDVM